MRGANNAQVPDVVGMKQGEATAALIAAGFKVTPVESSGSAPKGTVTGSSPNGSAIPGSLVTIYVSDGTVRTPPPPGPQGPPPGVPGLRHRRGCRPFRSRFRCRSPVTTTPTRSDRVGVSFINWENGYSRAFTAAEIRAPSALPSASAVAIFMT